MITVKSAMSPERELVLLLASVARRRDPEQISALAARVDFDALYDELRAQKLVYIGAGRVEAAAPGSIAAAARPRFEASMDADRRRSLLVEALTSQALGRLQVAGIRALGLKGPALARDLYGETVPRPSADVDLLVDASDFRLAIEALREIGYQQMVEPLMPNGLPIIHSTLASDHAGRPYLDLHWRIHWFDHSFSRVMLQRAVPADDGSLRATAADQLAALLLFYARDGFLGLRYAADIAAWWDRHGSSAAEGGPVTEHALSGHRELRASAAAAALVAQRLVGVPAEAIVPLRWASGPRARIAQRLVNWTQDGPRDQLAANITLVDGLLVPRDGMREFAERNLAISRTFGLGEGSEETTRPASSARARRAAYYASGLGKFGLRYGRALWSVRGGRSLSPLP